MKSYEIIKVASNVLRNVIWDSFNSDEGTMHLITGKDVIVFDSPAEIARDSTPMLSIWCYRIEESPLLRSLPMRPGDFSGIDQSPPFELDLFYLITPFGRSSEDDHLVLGKTIDALVRYETAPNRNSEAEVAMGLQVSYSRRTLDEMTRVWEALRAPYRLSICYQVRVSTIAE